jgi:hypothetical protein
MFAVKIRVDAGRRFREKTSGKQLTNRLKSDNIQGCQRNGTRVV